MGCFPKRAFGVALECLCLIHGVLFHNDSFNVVRCCYRRISLMIRRGSVPRDSARLASLVS